MAPAFWAFLHTAFHHFPEFQGDSAYFNNFLFSCVRIFNIDTTQQFHHRRISLKTQPEAWDETRARTCSSEGKQLLRPAMLAWQLLPDRFESARALGLWIFSVLCTR